MDDNVVLKLQLITLFDSISFGLIYCFINPHLLVIGGDHLTLGIFSVLYLLSQLISKDASAILTCNTTRYKSLFHVTVVGFTSHVFITLTSNCWIIIFSRCLFGLTNHVNTMTKDLILENVSKNQVQHQTFMHNVLSSVGYIIGPIISGCLFVWGFNFSCLLAAGLSIINVWLILSIDDSSGENIPECQDQPLIEKTVEKYYQIQKDLTDSDFKNNWDLVALKFFFSASVNIFFTKFTQILKHNFDSNSIVIGYTTAYMNAITVIAVYYLTKCKIKRESDTLMIVKVAFVTLLLALTISCYSPSYNIYCVMCIPMALSRNYISNIWPTIFDTRKNLALNRLNENAGLLAGLTIPILFGITCNMIEHHAVILFSILPLIICLYIFHKYTVPSYYYYLQKMGENVQNAKEEKSKDD